MVIFPHCKINLGLNIVRKRTDGYHDIETFFLPIPFYDCLEVIHNTQAEGGVKFSCSGLQIPGESSQNLCIKAYDVLKKDYPDLPSLLIHLHKNIPTGAGLGGGSADGAFMLRLLNAKFRLGITVDKLAAYALMLGSDAPFFVQDKPTLAKGRGEILESLAVSLSGYSIALVNPGIQISTAWAFSQLEPKLPSEPISSIITSTPETWKNRLLNDFETPVFEKNPEIKEIKEQLYNAGAVYASLSGSGSTVYGIFKGDLPKITFNPAYFIKEIQL